MGCNDQKNGGKHQSEIRNNDPVIRDNINVAEKSPVKVDNNLEDTDKNDNVGFSSRNQFDRASQLRRSRKKRKKSDVGNTSEVLTSPNKISSLSDNDRLDTADTVNTGDKETLSSQSVLSPGPHKTVSDIVKEECGGDHGNTSVNHVNTSVNSRMSVVSRLHDKTFSRAEYSSNYGNLI